MVETERIARLLVIVSVLDGGGNNQMLCWCKPYLLLSEHTQSDHQEREE